MGKSETTLCENEPTNLTNQPQSAERLGLILKASNGIYGVHVADADVAPRTLQCTLRGNLKKTFTYSTSGSNPRRVQQAKRPFIKDTAAVGDRVRLTVVDDETGIIEEILPRVTRFSRASFRGKEQTMVSNLDQLVIVFACAEPRPDLWRVDRWLAAAELYELEPLIIANKRDLVSDEEFHAAFDEYIRIGYRVIATSARKQIGLEALREEMRDRISAMTGPSGVGKSSLLNALQPGLKLDTGEIGYTTFKGRHTTTTRELLPLESGGWVADTPGLRSLELLTMDREVLANCFLEFRAPLEEGCRFQDCRHETEPGCSLKAALGSGAVSQRRYDSFLALARELKTPPPGGSRSPNGGV